jgi:hypothetical protein
MEFRLTWIIAAIGALTLAGVFSRMKEGFGPNNLRAVGIVLIATFASLLALRDGGALTAAMGILGGIGGYLFGTKDGPAQEPPKSPNVPNKPGQAG